MNKFSIDHLLDLSQWSKADYQHIFDLTDKIKKNNISLKYNHIKMANLFFEHSTRTSISFEIAAKSLGMSVINFSVLTSSQNKGEHLLDTVENLCAMGINIFVIRHPLSGTPHFITHNCRYPINVINAGDGEHAHPSQALIDCYTIYKQLGTLSDITISICGDILHSRVARSLITAFKTLQVKKIILCSPSSLLPKIDMGNKIIQTSDINSAVASADVIIGLRIQNERFTSDGIVSKKSYQRRFSVNKEVLAKAKASAIVMHPGPVVWGEEMEDDILDDKRVIILKQVEHSTFMRMAIIHSLIK